MFFHKNNKKSGSLYQLNKNCFAHTQHVDSGVGGYRNSLVKNVKSQYFQGLKGSVLFV